MLKSSRGEPLPSMTSLLWSDPVGARRRRAKALHRRVPRAYSYSCSLIVLDCTLDRTLSSLERVLVGETQREKWRNMGEVGGSSEK